MPDPAAPRIASAASGFLPRVQESRDEFGRPLRILAWLSFLAEVIIIGTGGAVRLTGSGLGCSEWPLCTPESLVPIYEVQGLHGLIEFGNRTMTGVVGLLALAVLLLTLLAIGGRRLLVRALWFALGGVVLAVVVYVATAGLGSVLGAALMSTALLLSVVAGAVDSLRRTTRRRDLAVLAWVVLVGIMAQAVVGGFTVISDLNPFIVGFHYTASLLLVCLTAAFLVRLKAEPGPRERAVPSWFAILTHITGLALAATIFFGVLTTGNGPHSGDADILRTGFDATVLAHVHSWPGYVLAALVAALTVAAWTLRLDPRHWLLVLVIAILVQVGVGVWQAREGLPEILVGIHMVLASLSAAAYTVVVLHLKRPAAV
ncbi:COX15/CtaA family protein [Microbacterium hydrocarbonoxydans]|uniref:COX15/CtaA family protein n=1 Tax=Microbacterium hydrocarbonoxydans TaxID=273678 RepID=UPI0007BC3712|nr:COX15/CtaA family protein [Microbacterium hydrocarbonoxydans]GAT73335.1 cytochrome oxidase assembly [Microbacterium sp. HM58-2]